MKKIFTLIALLICSFAVAKAQTNHEVIYLNDGSIIKGEIIGKTQDGVVKIQSSDGSLFVYNQNEIKQIKSEKKRIHDVTRKILDHPKHSFGIRGGIMMYSHNDVYDGPALTVFNDKQRLLAGAHIGGVYELGIDKKTNRWFFQTGLDFQYMNSRSSVIGNKDNDYINESLKTNSLFLEIPAVFSYRFRVSPDIILYPSVGIAYSVGLWSKYNYKYYDGSLYADEDEREYKESGNSFGPHVDCINLKYHCENPHMRRSTLLLKFGLNLTYKKIYVGISIGSTLGSFIGTMHLEEKFEKWGEKVNSDFLGKYLYDAYGLGHPFCKNINISVGYNF